MKDKIDYRQQFCKDLVIEFQTEILGNSVNNEMFTIAHDNSDSHRECYDNFEELARIALICYNLGKTSSK